MAKILWLDTETTGLDPAKHGIVQLAGAIEIDGTFVETFNFTMNPGDVEYDEKALTIHGITKDEILTYPDEFIVFNKFMDLLEDHVDKYNKFDKFIIAGYKVEFDFDMIKAWFIKNKQNYIMSYFQAAKLDVMVLCAYVTKGIRSNIDSFKLEAMCILFNIDLPDAHDAMGDIMATIKLAKKLEKDHMPIINVTT